MAVVLILRGTANGASTPMDGQYLKDFDFEADDGRGEIDMTPDLADAMTFPHVGHALAFRNRVPVCRPRREDGKPNRPLSSTTWEVKAI